MEKGMTSNIKLLDCTLRDGGYINEWEFGHENLKDIFGRTVDAGVDIIEIGYLDEKRVFDKNRSIMPDTDCVSKIYGKLDKKNALIVGMVDYGTCSLDRIQPAAASFLDGIRVIFKKHLRREAMAFCRELRKLGYLVFAQLVSVTSYEEEEIADLAELANEAGVDAVSMVDTYGLMHPQQIRYYFRLLDGGLKSATAIGYHGHNNLQMGYANCMEFLKYGTSGSRQLIVDATLLGMGKAAGNVPIELIAMHLNDIYGKNYRIGAFLEAIDKDIYLFYQEPPWGYNVYYFMAAYHKCHPSYVQYLMKNRRFPIRYANEVLGRMEERQKLLYNERYIEELVSGAAC